MQFKRHLHEGIRNGEITCTVRIWKSQRVKVGGRYNLGDGDVVVDSILPISLEDITSDMASQSGFNGLDDMLKVAKHGKGQNVYYIDFHYQDYRSIA